MKKNKFDLSNYELTTCDIGQLVPVDCREVLPNDTLKVSSMLFARMQPMLAPIMHPLKVIFQHWYMPSRLLWQPVPVLNESKTDIDILGGFEEFYTSGGIDTEYPAFPTITLTKEDCKAGSLANHLGIPLVSEGVEVNAMPFRMYNIIFNERYRDEDIEPELNVYLGAGNDTVTPRNLLSPCWHRDYFTTARLSTQRGARVNVPVSTFESPVAKKYNKTFRIDSISVSINNGKYDGITRTYQRSDNCEYFEFHITNSLFSTFSGKSFTFAKGNFSYWKWSGNKVYFKYSGSADNYLVVQSDKLKGISPLYLNTDITVLVTADKEIVTDEQPVSSIDISAGSSVSALVSIAVNTPQSYISIQDLATASHLQKLKEKSLKYGNRYEERIQLEFGTRPADSRIDRPQYLGGSQQTFQISEVLQTAEAQNSGVGTMRGHGTSFGRGNRYRFRFPEHGYVMTLMSIRPLALYADSMDRMWLRKTPTDFYLPDLANAGGFQEVWQQEIYGSKSAEKVVFGYQGRYDDYRFKSNRVSGDFVDTLDYWHLARKFSAPPVMNTTFLRLASGDFKRVFNSTDTNYGSILCMIKNNVKAYRPIHKRAKPTSIA